MIVSSNFTYGIIGYDFLLTFFDSCLEGDFFSFYYITV